MLWAPGRDGTGGWAGLLGPKPPTHPRTPMSKCLPWQGLLHQTQNWLGVGPAPPWCLFLGQRQAGWGRGLSGCWSSELGPPVSPGPGTDWDPVPEHGRMRPNCLTERTLLQPWCFQKNHLEAIQKLACCSKWKKYPLTLRH